MTKTPLTSRANPAQLDAITTTEGPLLIIAGPGSGKTFTLVERIIYLLTEKNIAPERVMVVTFTEKAAQELTTRISNRLDQIGVSFNLNEMYLGTFHSICLRWLKDYQDFTRLKRDFTIFDEFDQHYFVYQRFSEFEALEGINHLWNSQSTWDRNEQLVKWINAVAEEALDIETLLRAPDEAIQALGRCAQLYHEQLEENNALDFSTIQHEALKLLRDYPAVRDALKEDIAYVMVDEYQDTNTVQEHILLELVGTDNPNLCVVGDDDQGIYRFRGATIRNILQFGSAFTGPHKRVALETNYRSHEAIIEFCSRWMAGQDWTHEGQTFRYQKQIVPRPTEFPAMPAVVRVSAQSDEAWHEEILAFLHALKNEGQLTDWNQAAFLFRGVKNDKVRALAAFLERHGIPVYSPRANQFFDREEIRLMIGALLSLFPQYAQIRQWDADIHLKIWDYYDNKCSPAFEEQLYRPENAELLKWVRQKAQKHRDPTTHTDYAFASLFYELLQFPLFSRYLDAEMLKNGSQQSRAMRNLGLFSQLLKKFEHLHHITALQSEFLESNLNKFFNNFLRFTKDGGINEYEDEAEYAPSGYVSFLTIHQAKGLEFPIVLVDSLGTGPRKDYTELNEKLEGYLTRPSFEPLEQIKFYDFWRLYYTAFSRAQNLLVLTASEKTGQGRTPSKYFQDYYKGLPSWRDPALRLAELPLEKVKQANFKREYSFTSHITLYENCAERYRFFQELDFAPVRHHAAIFGNLVHQTIEDIHRAVIRGERQRISEDQIKHWFEENYAQITQKERLYLSPDTKRQAVEQVLRYYRNQDKSWSHIRQAEVEISLVKEQYILTGKADLLITGPNGTMELVDFKTDDKPDINDPAGSKKLNQYRRQLEIYAHIIEQRTGEQISKTHLYYTSEKDNPHVTFPRNGQSTQQTIESFDHIVSRIEAQDFTLKARPYKLCKECDMCHYCDNKKWQFRQAT